jgi:hypothetical protein
MQIGGQDTTFGGMRNRIINGDMRIDQRNAGAAVTTGNSFPVDRFKIEKNSDDTFSAQQDSSAPAGFTKSTKITITAADSSIGSTQYFVIDQYIEGYNVADLNWGSANAKTVTVSFWVRSSLTGTFGGSLRNDAGDRYYAFTYSISAADTWEQKSVTIAGDTSGTWLTTTGTGIQLAFSLGAGSSRVATAGSWGSGVVLGASGQTQVISTVNSTFYITGVQLEKGSAASAFENRQYGTELALCQRYFEIVGNGQYTWLVGTTNSVSGNEWDYFFNFMVQKRSNPTATVVGSWAYNNTNAANSYVSNTGLDGFNYIQIATGSGRIYSYNYTVGAYITFSAEL